MLFVQLKTQKKKELRIVNIYIYIVF